MPIEGDETLDMPLGPRNDYTIKIKDPGRYATGSTLLNGLPIPFSSTNNLDFVRLRLVNQNSYLSQSRYQYWYHQSHHHPTLITHQMYRPKTERHLPVFASISKGPQPSLGPMSNPHRTLDTTMNRLANMHPRAVTSRKSIVEMVALYVVLRESGGGRGGVVVAESVRVEDFRVGVAVWVCRKGREVGEENCFGVDVVG